MIDDATDSKPEDWEQPEHIADTEATKPEDWDDEMDGEWEAPQIDNPAFKGEWKPKQIDNPAYKGSWVHPEIENPDYVPDSEIYRYGGICGLGLDLWQVKSGTLFDNILITDDKDKAKEVRDVIIAGKVSSLQSYSIPLLKPSLDFLWVLSLNQFLFSSLQEEEKKMKDAQDEEDKKKADAEKGADDEKDDDEDADDDDDKEGHDEL